MLRNSRPGGSDCPDHLACFLCKRILDEYAVAMIAAALRLLIHCWSMQTATSTHTIAAHAHQLRSWWRHDLDSDAALVATNLAMDFLDSRWRVLGV